MSKQKIGEGMSGKVYYPALDCEDTTKQPVGDYVSKLAPKPTAEKEFAGTANLRALKPSGAIYPEHICEQKGNPTKSLLFSKYGGEELTRYLVGVQQASSGKLLWWQTPTDPADLVEVPNIIKALEKLREEIKYINSQGVYHNDVQADNIVYNPKTKQAYLIDFERMSDVPSNNDSKLIDSILTDFRKFSASDLKTVGQ